MYRTPRIETWGPRQRPRDTPGFARYVFNLLVECIYGIITGKETKSHWAEPSPRHCRSNEPPRPTNLQIQPPQAIQYQHQYRLH